MKENGFLECIAAFSQATLGHSARAVLTEIALLDTVRFAQPSTVYVGLASDAERLDFFSRCRCATLCLTMDVSLEYPEDFLDNNYVLEYANTFTVSALYDQILDCFHRTGGSVWPAYEFANMLLSKNSLSRVINTAAMYWNVPLIAGSPGGRKIYAFSQSTQPETPDSTWLTLVRTGEFSVEQHCKDMERNYGRDNTDNVPYFVYYPDSDKWRVMCKVFSENEYLGTLHTWDVSFQQLACIDVRLFRLLGSIVAHYISAVSSVHMDSFMSKDHRALLLGDLLDENYGYAGFPNENALYKRIMACNAMQLINIPLMEYKYQNNLDGQLIHELSTLYPHSLPFYYRRNVLVLLNLDKDQQAFTESAASLMELMERHALIAAVSDVFMNITDIINHYHQTNRIIAIANKMDNASRLLYNSDFKFYEMALAACGGQPENLKSSCHPVLLKIHEDARTGGAEDIYNTLREYVYTNKSLSQTAARLFLHKSTVAYRIANVKERYGLMLDDMEDVFKLYYSFHLLDMIDAEEKRSSADNPSVPR